ncbi:MAG: glycosyltransferase family 2 protein [Selenomonas massiliensis]
MKVSVAIVALNEERYLPSILRDVLNQTYLHSRMEVLLIDSMSTDETLYIMNDFRNRYQSKFIDIRVLKNPKKRQANGWNIAIKEYCGDVLIRIDAHAHIPCDFVEKNVKRLKLGEYVCGGRRPNIAEESTLKAALLLEAESAMFGSGISPFRNSDKSEYVKSIFHGAYRREVFDKVGGFNEGLGRTEDNDFHQRVRENGYNIFMDKDIISYQYVRPTLRKMMKQKFLNGYWIGKTTYINRKCILLYYYVPCIFVLSVISASIMAFLEIYAPLEILCVLYGMILISIGLTSIHKKKYNLIYIIVPMICCMVHISYGLGTIIGLVKNVKLCGKSDWSA